MILKKRIVFLSLFLIGLGNFLLSQNQLVQTENLRYHISVLASDSLQGRFPGTKGDSLAVSYLTSNMSKQSKHGFKTQDFSITTGINYGFNNNLVFNNNNLILGKDFSAYSYSANTKFSSDIFFCGYCKELSAENYNIIKNKWVLVLREPASGKPVANQTKSVSDRDKAMMLADKGAGGVVFVSAKSDYPDDILVELKLNQGNLPIPVINISRETADKLLQNTGFSMDSMPTSELSNLNTIFTASTEIIKIEAKTKNVYSEIHGSDLDISKDIIIIGAHFDHLGFGGEGSNSRRPDTTAVHYGADDNASGVAVMLELMRLLNEKSASLNKSYYFVAFGAEERGLLGSKAFIDGNIIPVENIKAMINLDMVGRLKADKSLQIGGVGTSKEADSLLNLINNDFGFKLVLSPEGSGPSDHAPFYAKDIPVFFISTGAHSDYHTPEDKPEKINYEGLTIITDYVYKLILTLDEMDQELTYQEAGPKASSDSRHGGERKVSFGIMPDFAATDIVGLRAEIVTPGKPAYLSGMQNGDIIKSINGNPVRDIQEYMYRLGQLNPGEQVNVDIERKGEFIVLIIQL